MIFEWQIARAHPVYPRVDPLGIRQHQSLGPRLRVTSRRVFLRAPNEAERSLSAVQSKHRRSQQLSEGSLRCAGLKLQLKQTVASHHVPKRAGGVLNRRSADVRDTAPVVHNFYFITKMWNDARELPRQYSRSRHRPYAGYGIEKRTQGGNRSEGTTAHEQRPGQRHYADDDANASYDRTARRHRHKGRCSVRNVDWACQSLSKGC